jgi:hypothetical protein
MARVFRIGRRAAAWQSRPAQKKGCLNLGWRGPIGCAAVFQRTISRAHRHSGFREPKSNIQIVGMTHLSRDKKIPKKIPGKIRWEKFLKEKKSSETPGPSSWGLAVTTSSEQRQ